MYNRRIPVKAKTITASPPPADTSQSQKKIRFWQHLCSQIFSLVLSLKYLEGAKLADVSEHLIVVKISASHGHWRRPDCMHGCRSERKLKSEMCSRPKK